MKRIDFGVCIVVFVFSFAAQAQVPGQPGSEYKKLEVLGRETGLFRGRQRTTHQGPLIRSIGQCRASGCREVFSCLSMAQQSIQQGGPLAGSSWLRPCQEDHIGYVFWLQWGGTATYTMTFKDRTILTGGQGWRQEWEFSPDGMSLTGKREREQDGKWWTAFDVKGVKK